MLDDRVRSVLARMEAQDADDHGKDIPVSERSLAVGPDSGRLLFALVAPNAGCEVLEIGSSHGYSTIWLAAAARILGGRVVTLEQEPGKIDVWRRNIADSGLEEWSELEDGFDVVFLDAWKDDYELLFGLARTKLDPGGIVVADNVTTSSTVEAYAAARQADPTLVSVTVPIGHGLEVTTVLQP